MPCEQHLPHIHTSHHYIWFRDVSDMRPNTPDGSFSSPINPAVAFPSVHTRRGEIGTGSEGNVDIWSHEPSGSIIAVKTYMKSNKELPVEVQILKFLPRHDSIINCLAYIPREHTLGGDAAFFEYCPAGDLFELEENTWKMTRGRFSEACMWSLYRQLSAAIAFLHEGIGCTEPKHLEGWRPVIHRDIKPENVFVMTLGQKKDLSNIVIKLGDFGLSAFYDPSNARMPGFSGTTVLWPPEQTWENRKATPAGDVWAVGCIVHELAHGFPPVVDPSVTAKAMKEIVPQSARIGHSVRKSYWEATTERKPIPINLEPKDQEPDARRKRRTPKYSDALNEAMMMALEISVEKRATAGELLRHVR